MLKTALLLTVKSAKVPLVPEAPPVRLVIFALPAVRPVKLALGAERPNVKSPVVAVIVFTFVMLLLHIFSGPVRDALEAIKEPVDRLSVLILFASR